MVEEVAAAPAPAPATPVKKSLAEKAAAKPKTAKAAHPPASQMVLTAITELKERNGSSLQAIKKFIAAKFLVDPKSQAHFIKKYLKSAVESGALVQTKGTGAAGSFKLPVTKKAAAEDKPKAPKAKAPKAKAGEKAAKPKTATAKKSPKKTAAAPKTKKVAAPKTKKADKSKAAAKKPAISKKSVKAPTSKPKSPKAKIAPAKKSAKK